MMRVLAIRVSILGGLVLLGWITIANAQRGDDNPLRGSSSASPALRRPMDDPFGLQSQRNEREDEAVSASAEEQPTGPALGSEDASRPAARLASRPKPPARETERRAAPVADEVQEPAPFMADPFAMPANPQHEKNTDRPQNLPPASERPSSDSTAMTEGIGQPGGQQLEGIQTPQLSIQKLAPKEVQVGRPASFRVTVRNIGQTPAADVEIRDLVPKGTRLLGTLPQAGRNDRGELVWTLGTIQPGAEVSVEMQVMPIAEGEIGSVATVHFGADASARAVATRPQLVVQASAPEAVLIGEQVVLQVTVSNPGTGMASGVVLEERIPPGLQHPAGTELEYEVGDLKPGETRKLELPLVAARPGPVTNLLSARGEGNLRAEHKLDLEVLAPQLDVIMEGPKRRYLERQATYHISITNPGTAPAKQVELSASLPPGLKFVRANNNGYYDEPSRTVRWRLEELPAAETGTVELVTMPIVAGQQAVKLRGAAQKGLLVEKEHPVIVEGIAAILFQVADTVDPLELGGETIYEVRVVNQGSKSASNVRLAIILPPELKAVAAEGPTRHATDADRVLFDGLGQLPPKGEVAYRLRVKAQRPGDLRVRFQLLTDDMQTPVTKEESTRVYADE